jgi:hypothetical protein
MYSTFATHKIENPNQLSFSAADYSRFKFGDKSVAKIFGQELGYSFIGKHADMLLHAEELVVIPSPYNAIPTASGLMSVYFKEIINQFLYRNNKPLLLESKIQRYNTYSIDYSKLAYAERLELMASDTYHFQESFLNNKTCLFIDDIRITGSHEEIIKNMLEEKNLRGQFLFIYYAALDNKNIDPALESYLNTYSVKSLADVTAIVNSEWFSPNTRVIKYILNSDPSEIRIYLSKINSTPLRQMIDLALQNNYHHMTEYRDNFYTLLDFLGVYKNSFRSNLSRIEVNSL